jgi:hypothetical protein
MPGVTAGEILEALNLEGACVLWACPNHPFSEEEVMYDRVTDADRLWVSYYGCVCGG